jgi:DNA-binding response OmpR family regulator
VQIVKSGKELVEIADKMTPELVIMDVIISEMNGFEVIKALRANGKTARTPILITSPLDVRERVLDAGANVFILKPYNSEKFMEVVRSLLANRKVEGY